MISKTTKEILSEAIDKADVFASRKDAEIYINQELYNQVWFLSNEVKKFINKVREILDNEQEFCTELDYRHIEYASFKKDFEDLVYREGFFHSPDKKFEEAKK